MSATPDWDAELADVVEVDRLEQAGQRVEIDCVPLGRILVVGHLDDDTPDAA